MCEGFNQFPIVAINCTTLSWSLKYSESVFLTLKKRMTLIQNIGYYYQYKLIIYKQFLKYEKISKSPMCLFNYLFIASYNVQDLYLLGNYH